MRWFARPGLRVLMYHKVSHDGGDSLTVTPTQLEAQMRWLLEQGVAFVTAAQIASEADGGSRLPADSVLVTFDDAYVDTLELAFPLLQRLGIRAVVFVPTAYIGAASNWDSAPRPIMTGEQLAILAAAKWEIGLHSHAHPNYQQLSPAAIRDDLEACRETLQRSGLPPCPALAYPYGRRPRTPGARSQMQADLRGVGVRVAFRIGNRINGLPLRHPFEINRIGVRGDRSLAAFKRQVWWGRLF